MHVVSLHIHPVKSLGGMPVKSSDIDRFGLRWDRRWMVVDEAGKFLTQRQLPAMALIRVSLDQGRVTLTAAQGEAMVFDVVDFVESPLIRVQVWRDQCEARLGSEAINVWLSRVLGRDCRLVFMDDHCRRPVDEHYAGPGHTVSFADGYPLSLSNLGKVKIITSSGEYIAPVIGRVNMDQITVDLTDIPDATIGIDTQVQIIDDTRDSECSLVKLAQTGNTHVYEMLCRLSWHVPRRYVTMQTPAIHVDTNVHVN